MVRLLKSAITVVSAKAVVACIVLSLLSKKSLKVELLGGFLRRRGRVCWWMKELVANRYAHEHIFFEFCITIRAIESS